MPLTPDQWSLVGSHYAFAVKTALYAVPVSLRHDPWIDEVAVDGAINRLWSLAESFDPARNILFATYAWQPLYLAARTRVNAELNRRIKLRRTRLPCSSRFLQFGEPDLSFDDQEMIDRILRFAGTPHAAEFLKRHCIDEEPLVAISEAFGYSQSNGVKIKRNALAEIRAAFHAGLIGAT